MTEGTAVDWQVIAAHAAEFNKSLPDRVLTHLQLLAGDSGGFSVDRLEHSLQTATRAAKAGKDDEYVVCALIHDIGDTLGSYNHPDIAAAILKPFVSEENLWMVEMHGVFQGYNFFHHLGLDRDMREQYRDHPCYDRTVEFCQEYDQPAFEPGYPSMTLADFDDAVRAVMAKPVRSLYLKSPIAASAT